MTGFFKGFIRKSRIVCTPKITKRSIQDEKYLSGDIKANPKKGHEKGGKYGIESGFR
jgi:hypothetical protein